MRREDWPERLDETIERYRHKRFKWGKADCGLFAADCIEAMTDIDYAADYRGQYKNEEEAKEVLKELAAGTTLRTMDSHFKRIPVLNMQRGDIGMHQRALGVCTGRMVFFLTPEDGLRPITFIECNRAWRIE